MNELQSCLAVSVLLFAIGLGGVLTRRNAIVVLMGVELMLNAANLNFVAFWRFGPHAGDPTGVLFVLSPGFMNVLWEDPWGVQLLMVAGTLQVVGSFIISRLVRIEY